MTKKQDNRFGHIIIEDGKTEEWEWRRVRVMGVEYIFMVLCLMCEIMIYRLPVRSGIDKRRVDNFKKQLEDIKG